MIVALKTTVILLLLVLSPGCTSDSVVEESGRRTLIVAGSDFSPPYQFVNEDGDFDGFDVDVINAVVEEMGAVVEYRPMAWKEATDALKKGEVDIVIGMVKTPERDEWYDFTDSYLHKTKNVFVLKDRYDIKDIDDLDGLKVVVQEGTYAHEFFRGLPNVQLVLVAGRVEAIQYVVDGKADALGEDKHVTLYYSFKKGYQDLMKIVGEPFGEAYSCLAVKQGDSALLADLNTALKSVKDSGQVDKMYNKWFGQPLLLGFEREKVFRVLYMVVGGLILLFLGSLAWNRSLQGKVREGTRELRESEATLRESELRYRDLFDNSPISLWEEDFSKVKEYLDDLTSSGVSNLRAHLEAHPDTTGHCAQMVDILDVNKATINLFGAASKDEILGNLDKLFIDQSLEVFREELMTLHEGKGPFRAEIIAKSLRGNLIDCVVEVAIAPGYEDLWSRVLVSVTDITERKRAEEALQQQAWELAALNALSQGVSASLSLDQVGKSAIDGIINSTHPDLALIFLRQGDRLFLKWAAPDNSKFVHEETHVHRVGECLCGLAVTERKPIYSVNIHNDPRCTWNECKKAGAHSLAAFPLRSGDHIIGVLGLASGTERIFEDQATFLETLSSQVSIGLQNALLHEELESHAAGLEEHVANRTAELKKKTRDLERFNKLFVDRELRMAELKKEIRRLREKA